MDLNQEKERLLELIEVYNMYDEEDEIDIALSNFDLNIERMPNSENHNLTIICDIDVDCDFEKYNKSNSEIAIDYTLNDEEYSTLYLNTVSIYFDGGLFEPEFTGHKIVKHTIYDINLEEIEEILIEIDARLYKKEDDDGEGIEIIIEFDQEKFEDELRKLGFTKHD